MKALIATPFADSRAADLSLAYGLAPLPALGTHRVEQAGARIDLRVLGASHQVVLEVGGTRWSETVACLPDRPGSLPAHEQVDAGLLRSRFTASCLRLGPARLAEQVRAIARRCERHPGALVGTFPGSPLAITALLVADRAGWKSGVGWRTWHVYPQTGELVTTVSVVMAR
ncbi:MAG: DUF2617 family protein [Pseudonocardiaceae bacterium]